MACPAIRFFFGVNSVFPDESAIDSIPEQHLARDHIHRSTSGQFSSARLPANFLETSLAHARIIRDRHCDGFKHWGLLERGPFEKRKAYLSSMDLWIRLAGCDVFCLFRKMDRIQVAEKPAPARAGVPLMNRSYHCRDFKNASRSANSCRDNCSSSPEGMTDT